MCTEDDVILDGLQRPSPATRSVSPGQDEAHRLWTKPFVRLLATNAAFGFSGACFYLLPKHLTVDYSAQPAQVGRVMSVLGLTCVLMVPALGPLANRLGLRRTLMLAFCLMAGACFGFVLADHIGPTMLFLRAVQGVATACVMTAGIALTAQLAPPDKLGRAMGLTGAASLIMSAVAPAVAEPLAARCGFAYVSVIAGLASLIGLIIARGIPHTAPAPAGGLSLDRRVLPILACIALVSAGFFVVMTFLAPLALTRNVPNVSGFFVAYTAAALAMRVLGAGLTDSLGSRRTAVLSAVIYGAVIAGIAAVGPRSLIVLGLGFGAAHGSLYPALMALLFTDVEPRARTPLAGLANGVIYLGMLSVWGFGQLGNSVGLTSVFVVGGIVVAASALLLAPQVLRRPATCWRDLGEAD
jgi:predicted MFS family arabinose efflux permease